MIRLTGLAAALIAAPLFFVGVPSQQAAAQMAGQPGTLGELLERVRENRLRENRVNEQRLREFRNRQAEQQSLLNQARADLAAAEQRSDELETQFEENEIRIAELEALLAERQGEFGELFGVVRQVAGDMAGQVEQSLISSQVPGRAEFLRGLAQTQRLPRVAQLERLWTIMQEEAIEQGRVVRYSAEVVSPDGKASQKQVVRVGPFIAVADGRFVRYESGSGGLVELGRQPQPRYVAAASMLESAQSGFTASPVDPSRGAILGLLVQSPSLEERIHQGGVIGYIIIVLAIIGVLMALERIVTLSLTAGAVKGQVKKGQPSTRNPLGRVMAAYEANKSADTETIELKLDEAILKELPKLERGLTTIKVLAAVSPLLGLLGTVTGMILTFQAITLFGTGDPKMMAGGISQALITTVLGLCGAIPLLLLHSVANGRSKAVIETLEGQAAGLIAQHAEGSRAA